MPGLSAEINLRVGELDLAVGLDVAPGEAVAVLGPNGAGKTTLLRALAGLQTLDSGRVTLDGTVLDDPGRETLVAPERRPIGMVFQDGLLFPHLSVLENVAFGLRTRGVGRTEARRRAHGWLARIGLADRATTRPHQLSGGQAQRVALARALVAEPRLLLLDEPLAALDASVRPALRAELRAQLAVYEGVRIIVTHDPLEAAALADRLVVLESGRLTHEGTLADFTARPRSGYVADLVGVNFYSGRAAGRSVDVDGFALAVAEPAQGDVLVTVAPRAVGVFRHRPDTTARNVWEGVCEAADPEGERVRLRIGGALPIVAEITEASARELAPVPGTTLWLSVKATEITVLPA